MHKKQGFETISLTKTLAFSRRVAVSIPGSKGGPPTSRARCTFRGAPMATFLRLLAVAAGSVSLISCAQVGRTGIDRADSLGIDGTAAEALPTLPPLPPPPASLVGGAAFDKTIRDQYVEMWMARSDSLCREYKDRVIRASRDARFATDASRTILSGLATIFTSVSVIHPLTGAATIIGGVGSAADDDFFQRQGGELIASAIQTARESQANQIEFNLKSSPADYNIWRAHRDVVDYHNMCSLETALSQIRSSLKATSPDGGITPPAAQGTQRPSAPPPDLRSPGSPPPGQPTPAPPPVAGPSNAPPSRKVFAKSCGTVSADVATGVKELSQNIRKLSRDQLTAAVNDLSSTTALKGKLTASRVQQLQAMSLTNERTGLILDVGNSVCNTAQLDEVRPKIPVNTVSPSPGAQPPAAPPPS
jgi:hypothetical protein